MFQVILGGGRRSFIPKDEMDPEAGNNYYQGRLDGRNLINVSDSFFIIGPQPRQNFSYGVSIKRGSNQSPKPPRLARKMQYRLYRRSKF